MKPEGDLFHCLAPKAKGLHPKLVLDQVFHFACEATCLLGDAFALFGLGHKKRDGADGDSREQDTANAIHMALFSAEHPFFSFRVLYLICASAREFMHCF